MKRQPIFASFASLILGAGLLCASPWAAAQQAQGVTPQGISVTQDVAVGWSVKKSLLGKTIYNQKEEEIGVINDLLIGPDSTISHVIVATAVKSEGAERKQDVAIDASVVEVHNGKFYVQVEGQGEIENVRGQPQVDMTKFL